MDPVFLAFLEAILRKVWGIHPNQIRRRVPVPLRLCFGAYLVTIASSTRNSDNYPRLPANLKAPGLCTGIRPYDIYAHNVSLRYCAIKHSEMGCFGQEWGSMKSANVVRVFQQNPSLLFFRSGFWTCPFREFKGPKPATVSNLLP